MYHSLPPGARPAALPDSGLERFFLLGIKIVAAAGGALVGWLVGAPVVRVLVRLAFHRETPPAARLLSRMAGAVLVGFLAFLIVGWGTGSGGPGPNGKDSGTPNKDKTAVKLPQDKMARDKKTASSGPVTLVIRVLGGDAVTADRYYQLTWQGQKGNRTEAEVKKILEDDSQGDQRIKGIDIVLDLNSPFETNPAVTDLVKLCEKYMDLQGGHSGKVKIIKEN